MTLTRYAVADVPTSGPDKGKITKVWDFDLTFTDAHVLRKRLANKRWSKWPVVLEDAATHAKVEHIDVPTPAQMVDLKIDPAKFASMSPEDEDKLVQQLAGELGAVLDPLVAADVLPGADAALAAAKAAAEAANIRAAAFVPSATSEVPEPPAGALEGHNPSGGNPISPAEPTPVSIAPGYMGDPTKWCWWESEYADDGVFGPYDSEQAVRELLAGEKWYVIEHVYTEESYRKVFKLPAVTKNADGLYTAGPPPDGRTVDEHLNDLIDGPCVVVPRAVTFNEP